MIAATLFAAALALRPIEVHPTTEGITIDGRLDEAAWRTAKAIPIAYEWYPGDDTPAPVQTDVYVTFDTHNIYVGFRASDPNPSAIRARFEERDGATDDDDGVGFYIDPFNDDRRAWEFRANPLGVQTDAIYSDVEKSKDFSWNVVWESAGKVTPDGYVVEMAIPLQQLRIPSATGPQTWGFIAFREWPRDVRHRLRSAPTDQNRDCFVCQLQDLRGIEVKHSGKNVELDPSITGSNDDAFDAGLSARWAMTPGTSLQATLNPDFSQVEADAAQLDVNTQFALYYPEKRPFFVEGADVFETRLPLVFTRNVADPQAGVKLTGKSGANLFGALAARDEITNVLVPGDQSDELVTVPGASTDALFRYRRELGSNGSLGGAFTAREGHGYSNRVLAADSFARMTERDSFRVQVAASRTDYPQALIDAVAEDLPQKSGAFGGYGIGATWSRSDRNGSMGADYTELSPDFRADAGFLNQVGIRAASVSADRRIRGGADRWFRTLFVGGGVDGTQQYDGRWTEWGADLNLRYQGPHQSDIRINLAPNQEYYAGTTYHNFRYGVSGSLQATRDVVVGFGVRAGETIDFAGERQARFITLSPAADINIGRQLRGELAYDYQRLQTNEGAHIYDVHLPQARILYHFNRRAYIRTILQYRLLDEVETDQRLLGQFLFSYRLDAQTALLAGYSDNYAGEDDLRRTNRAVFVKLSYAWLF